MTDLMEVGFCDGMHRGFSATSQPSDQIERWQLPYDNGTHLVVHWTPARSACGLNVTSYYVDVKTSSSSLNRFVDLFGRMPQDVCAASSKARSSVAVDDVQQGEGQLSACTPYRCHRWKSHTNVSAVAIPRALRALASWDVVVSIRAYGTIETSRDSGREKAVNFWCHKYRRRFARPSPSEDAAAGARRSASKRFEDAWRSLSWSDVALPLATLILAVGATRCIGALERAVDATALSLRFPHPHPRHHPHAQ